MVEAHHHRPTLKQQNKPYKSKHATKSALKEASKGRISRQSPKASNGQNTASQTRLNRRNNAKQIQVKKRQAIVSATRLFSGPDGVPRIIAVIPLAEDVSARHVSSALATGLESETDGCPETGLWKIRAERFKTSLQFINLPYRSLYAALDAAKVADYVVFVLSPVTEVDAWGDTLLRTLQSQGMPEVVSVVAPHPSSSNSGNFDVDSKARPGILKSLLSFMQYFVPSQNRVFDLSQNRDVLNAVRAVCEGKPGEARWRDGRCYLMGEQVNWVPNEAESGVLSVTGVLRGGPLSANRLVHIPNYGDFQIQKILSSPAPKASKIGAQGMEVEPTLLAEPDVSSADSLISENDPDDMANEQTWPTEEEMQGNVVGNGLTFGDECVPDALGGTTPKRVKKVPKGWSSYQAAWIVDDDDDDEGVEEGEEEEGENAGDMQMEDEEMVELRDDDTAAHEQEMDLESRKSVQFQDLDMDEEKEQLDTWRKRQREEADDLQFPDEIDTPMEVPARTRFQRYRGLRSFRTSPWDPYENLPRDYARIFQFEDFKRTERNVLRRAREDDGAVEPGTRVTVYLKDVPKEAATPSSSSPFVVFGLLQHEHKKTVLNFTVQRNTEYDGSVRSKDQLILCVGPRRLIVNPVYSQHTRGGAKGSNNVHKFERYLRHGVTSIATVYGPAVFGKQPCMLLRETADPQAPELVASGAFVNPDPTRIIAKRIILTGHPFKVHKKTATVRYMFFNADDVNYFAPVQLHTKYGRTGHIRESLGTHGYFKAYFDGPINQMDTVCMSLYKRVYPRWSQLWREKRMDSQTQPESADVVDDAMEE
ncbi:ribosome biogenesis protein tsr1 [Punctularia strigosozonata HHB-11173 SS5]|uniref:ribosome biogenesis protein tsr1 n=1 Tax=Punctularia strigosozonata (strain HHB-11173) TaxID=741275 RepID=UPI00044163FB|nr:ribosome biogenesis protein tsr1 [Punctularia strigosozonata HHB-11173 SS5]EIN07032.1 ribosome biogenesis protein tsr1 [Punctularia strigosozonata HHB-11173 SS5]